MGRRGVLLHPNAIFRKTIPAKETLSYSTAG